MFKFLIIGLLFVQTAFAQNSSSWMSMIENKAGSYRNIRHIKIRNPKLKQFIFIPAGSLFYLNRHEALPGLRVQHFMFQLDRRYCIKGMRTFNSEDINILRTYSNPRIVEIGLAFENPCIMNVFVENKDLRSGNLLKAVN